MRTLGIIPARYASTRFPAKPLVDINGKSMIKRVYQQAQKCALLSKVLVATDDIRIEKEVQSFGGNVVMTSMEHPSGTDRCLEALKAEKEKYEVVVNIQGDEPFISPSQIELILSCFSNSETQIATLIKQIDSESELFDKNKPKVVVSNTLKALLFSRQTIPAIRDCETKEWLQKRCFYKHIGMYAYRSNVLEEICALKPSSLELSEGLEQLRWLENGYTIQTAITSEEALSVDTPEDLEKILTK